MKNFFEKRLTAHSVEPKREGGDDKNKGGQSLTTKTTLLGKLSRLGSSNNIEKSAGGKPNLKIIVPNQLKIIKSEQKADTDAEFPKQTKLIFVQKWIDYSTKYGLSYVLSNGVIGLHFNDNTKMVSSLTQPEMVEYITKNAE